MAMATEAKSANTETTTTEVHLSEEEKAFNKRVEAEADRKLASALAKKEKEWQEQLNTAIEKAKTDAEEYVKLTAAEKEKARQKEIEDKLALREKALSDRELAIEIKADLSECDLPTEFSEWLLNIGDGAKIKTVIQALKVYSDKLIADKVGELAKQDDPKGARMDYGTQAGAGFDMAKFAQENRIIGK